MKIAIFSASLDINNGYGNITHELCKKLQGKIDFTLFLPKNALRPGRVDYPVEYILPRFIFHFKTRKILEYLFLPKIKDIQGFDIIHSLFAFPYCLLAARFARRYQKPLLIGAQGTYGVEPLTHWPERYFLTRAYNQAKFIINPSRFTKEKIQQFSRTKTPIRVIHNGVNFEGFQKEVDVSDLRQRYGNKKILLTVGELKPRKGQDVVVRSLAIVKKEYGNFHYFIVGRKTWGGYLEGLVNELNLQDSITLLGEVSDEELVRMFHFCDIYIHTPRLINWNFEGFGIVYLEAGVCKKPIIASRSGGVEDAVLDGKTGLIVPEEDVDATAGAILKLFNDPGLCESLGEAGHQYAREQDWSIISSKFIDIYKSL